MADDVIDVKYLDLNILNSELIADNMRLRAELAARAAAETGPLTEENERLRADLALLAVELKCEANRRGWCSDYEYWVRHMNPKLSKEWLHPRNFDEYKRCDICGREHYG